MPIFKKCDKVNRATYRPISLTSMCSKIMEHVINSYIVKHPGRYNVQFEEQHDFRKITSVEMQLLVTISSLAKSIDK